MSESSIIPRGTRVYCKLTEYEAARLNVHLVDSPTFQEMDSELFLVSPGAILIASVDGSESCGGKTSLRLRLEEVGLSLELFDGKYVPYVTNWAEFSPGTCCGDDTYLESIKFEKLSKEAVASLEAAIEDTGADRIPAEIEQIVQFPTKVSSIGYAVTFDGSKPGKFLVRPDDIRGQASDLVVWLGDIEDADVETLAASVGPNPYLYVDQVLVISKNKPT